MRALESSGLVIWLLAVLLLGAGCASPKVDWNSRVGAYTHDDAVRELGPPDKTATLTDGTVVADWLTARGWRTATAYGGIGYAPVTPYGAYGFAGPGFIVVDPPSPDRFLRLTFDPQGKLASWKRTYR